MEPKVSIIIPTFGRSDRITRAIDSALNQSYNNIEVIVVDDNDPKSIDRLKTEENVSKYLKNPKFKYFQHKKNLNGAVARNTGIKHSEGDYITFLDDDDEYYNDKVMQQVNALSNLDFSWGMCYTGYKKIDQFGKIQVSAEKAEGFLPVQSLSKNLFMGSGSNFMIRKEIIDEVNGFDETFQRNQDLEFMSRILLKYKIKYVNYMGILIHNEIREKKYTYNETKAINLNYKKRFSKIIAQLSSDDQNKVWLILSLIDLRAALSFKEFGDAISIYRNSKLNFIVLIKYFYYILYRAVTKKSFGFKL
ncbi:glycosyltransferase family 2 protein [Aerococcus sp. HMSC10H05]|uniref:glycosyltransferase family 2 protein n=1 Tax=Aerococcus sp. HMSC10H05 TaxID=1581084 RepID=UPI0008A4E0F2|nr:glycosyltransferase family 2 protein [Aerococcus sp. HMSC10H05]OFU49969.1 hypothetical protein HMPREF3116_06165 [Aerococcus sp. HMSC10H05]